MAIPKILKNSLIGATGVTIGLFFIKVPFLAGAVGFINFNHGHTVDEIGDVVIKNGFFGINTANSAARDSFIEDERIIRVEGESLDSTVFPFGGAGFLFEATASGKVSFDWIFENENADNMFGFAIFDDADEFDNTLDLLPSLTGSSSESINFDHFFDQGENELLADGTSGRGTISFDVKKGAVFGFGIALGSSNFNLHDCIDPPNFTLSDIAFTPSTTEVPTPAAILPVLTGMFAAARRRKNNTDI